MLAIRARYDGKEILVPKNAQRIPPCDVIVLFEDDKSGENGDWLKMQEQSLEKAWDDKEDAIYDQI